MIIYWLVLLVRKLVWLFRIPDPRELARVDKNAKCPACGYSDAELRCVVLYVGPPIKRQGPIQDVALSQHMKVLVQHKCKQCGCRWFEPPVAEGADPTKILACAPRNDLEKSEDRDARLEQRTTD